MEVVELKQWDDFKSALKGVDGVRENISSGHGVPAPQTLFRGVGCNKWGLNTTLERSYLPRTGSDVEDLSSYYELAYGSRTRIESATDQRWPELPLPDQFLSNLEEFRRCFVNPHHVFGNPYINNFLIYLRHHGYPSPLLDWTECPFIAAFFAFDGMAGGADFVSIHATVRDIFSISSGGDARVVLLGPLTRTHRRHQAQRSNYTACMALGDKYKFARHDEILGSEGALGPLGRHFRIDIPATERFAALEGLDLMNINSHLLFDTEDSLMRTLSRRAGLYYKL